VNYFITVVWGTEKAMFDPNHEADQMAIMQSGWR
jgi:hypothetical protein